MMATAARTTLARSGAVARLTLVSADGSNRIDAETVDGLQRACQQLAGDGVTRVLIVSAGAGVTFCGGWSAEVVLGGVHRTVPGDPFGCLAALPLPVIAEINGDTFSAGLELALACDLRVASTQARLAFPETEFGLIPLAGGTQRLPRAVGRGRALSMILLGETVAAATALEWGLVNAVLERDRLTGEVDRLAGVLAARGPIAERFAKEAVQLGVELPLARALRYELDLTVLLQTTEDRAEGVRAFTEKRTPHFEGR